MANSPRMRFPIPSQGADPWYDQFVSLLGAVDASTYAAREDRNAICTGSGVFTWNATTGVLTWDSTFAVLAANTGFLWQVAAGSVVIPDGSLFYINVVRAPSDNNTLTPQISTNLSAVPDGDNAVVICVRVGMLLFFRNGSTMETGDSIRVFVGGNGTKFPTIAVDGESFTAQLGFVNIFEIGGDPDTQITLPAVADAGPGAWIWLSGFGGGAAVVTPSGSDVIGNSSGAVTIGGDGGTEEIELLLVSDGEIGWVTLPVLDFACVSSGSSGTVHTDGTTMTGDGSFGAPITLNTVELAYYGGLSGSGTPYAPLSDLRYVETDSSSSGAGTSNGFYLIDTTSGPVTMEIVLDATFTSGDARQGQTITFKKSNDSNPATISSGYSFSGQTVEGGTNFVLVYPLASVTFVSDGAGNWAVSDYYVGVQPTVYGVAASFANYGDISLQGIGDWVHVSTGVYNFTLATPPPEDGQVSVVVTLSTVGFVTASSISGTIVVSTFATDGTTPADIQFSMVVVINPEPT